jgi:hypothetical protein
MSAYDTDYRLKKLHKLNVAAIYLPSYYKSDDQGTFKTASDLLVTHNIRLHIWPTGGGKESQNRLIDRRYKDPIPHTREAYQQLRKDVNQLIKNRLPEYPHVVPVIFCVFVHPGHGITPPDTKIGAQSPACLISPNKQKDRMTVMHELGHAAGCHHEKGTKHEENVMHTLDGQRQNLYKFQIETLAKAIFVRR